MKRLCLILSIVIVAFGGTTNADAKTNEELTQENVELRQRVEKLESQLKMVLDKLAIQENTAAPVKAKDECATCEKQTPLQKLCQFPVSIYGHFKLDGAYDDSRTNSGNTTKFVLPDNGDEDDEFNLTARHTRLGLSLKAPEYKGITTDANLEIDFYGKGDELQSNLRLRHAYFALTFPQDFRIMAGQTWDVQGPINMCTLNTAVGWGAGNIAYRHPQLRLEKWFGDSSNRLKLQVAAARPYSSDHDADTHDDGEDAGIPDFQGRISYQFTGPAKKPIVLGLGGHWGQRELDADGNGSDENYDSWSVVLDAAIPLHKTLTLEGELWTGQYLDSYNAGIHQGFSMKDGEEVESTGGFAQLKFCPDPDWKFFGGFGIDDPKDDTVSKRERNLTYFFNIRRALTKNAWFGLEYQRFETDYDGGDEADDNRFQTTFCLSY